MSTNFQSLTMPEDTKNSGRPGELQLFFIILHECSILIRYV